MSISSMIYGVNPIEDFKNIFGGGDLLLAKALYTSYRDHLYGNRSLDSLDQEYEEGVEKMVMEAIFKGGDVLLDLEFEYPDVICRILVNQNGVIYPNFDYASEKFFYDTLEKVCNDIKPLIKYFIDGRKLFSEGNTNSEFPYAYLTVDEMKIILKDMVKNPESYSDSENFDKDFRECLELFIFEEKDLFYWQL